MHMGMDIRQTNCPSRHKGGTWGVLGGQQFKSLGKLSDWHQLWFTSADSPGNGHRLNPSCPSIPQEAFEGGGGVGGHKFKSLGKLSNGCTDWHRICGILGVLGGQQFKRLGNVVIRLGRLGINFAHITQVNLEMDTG